MCIDSFYVCKDGKVGPRCFCRRPELIENYDLMVKDTSNTIWVCHHRLETHFSDGTERPKDLQLSRKKLIALGMYYDRPPEELIFLTTNAHTKLHYKGRVAVQCIETGQIFESLKAAIKWAGLKCSGGLRQACKVPRYTAGGYHWRYI